MAKPGNPHLIVIHAEHRGLGYPEVLKFYELRPAKSEYTIGRRPESDFLIPSHRLTKESVAENHLVLRRGKAGFSVENLGSEAGTHLNGSPLKSRALAHADVITIRKPGEEPVVSIVFDATGGLARTIRENHESDAREALDEVRRMVYSKQERARKRP